MEKIEIIGSSYKYSLVNFSVSKDFSKCPAGPKMIDGPYSAEYLRSIIVLFLTDSKQTIVNLDGTIFSYASSFLKELFGELKQEGFSRNYLLKHLTIVSNEEPSLINECWSYIL